MAKILRKFLRRPGSIGFTTVRARLKPSARLARVPVADPTGQGGGYKVVLRRPRPGRTARKPASNGPVTTTPPATEVNPGVRPFLGYDVERATYQRLKAGLLADYAGKHVVLVGNEIAGPFDTFGAAVDAGYDRFGAGAVYVRQVLAVDPVIEIGAVHTPC